MATRKRKLGPHLLPKQQINNEGSPVTREYNSWDMTVIAAGLLPFIRAVVPDHPCDGGFLCITNSVTAGQYNIIFPVGTMAPDKINGRRHRAEEKAMRLFSYLDEGHQTSGQSRDPKRDRWGGAIAVGRSHRGWPRMILSFSGLPEWADEAFMLLVAVYIRKMTIASARKIAAINNNPYFEPALRLMLKAA